MFNIDDRVCVYSHYVHTEAWKTLQNSGAPIVSKWLSEVVTASEMVEEVKTATALLMYVEAGSNVSTKALLMAAEAHNTGVPVVIFIKEDKQDTRGNTSDIPISMFTVMKGTDSVIDLGRRLFNLPPSETITTETPRYEHDCKNCVFLGWYDNYDLYYCPTVKGGKDAYTVLARFGEGNDYHSGAYVDLPELIEARKRAVARGITVPDTN